MVHKTIQKLHNSLREILSPEQICIVTSTTVNPPTGDRTGSTWTWVASAPPPHQPVHVWRAAVSDKPSTTPLHEFKNTEHYSQFIEQSWFASATKALRSNEVHAVVQKSQRVTGLSCCGLFAPPSKSQSQIWVIYACMHVCMYLSKKITSKCLPITPAGSPSNQLPGTAMAPVPGASDSKCPVISKENDVPTIPHFICHADPVSQWHRNSRLSKDSDKTITVPVFGIFPKCNLFSVKT